MKTMLDGFISQLFSTLGIVKSMRECIIACTGWPKKNNTETNQNDTDTNDIFGTKLYTMQGH